MRAKEVMSRDVVSIAATASAFEAAERLVSTRVSGMPVVDDKGHIVGLVSEGDLIDGTGSATAVDNSGQLLRQLADTVAAAAAFVRARSLRVADVMSREVIGAEENASLSELADLMTRNRIKRVPILKGRKVVGIVSRIDLLRALISTASPGPSPRPAAGAGVAPPADDRLRQAVEAATGNQRWTTAWPAEVVVSAGVVHLWGVVPDDAVLKAYGIAVAAVPGVVAVENHMHVMPRSLRHPHVAW